MMTNNQRLIAQKDELIHRLSWNEKFGCYNRQGFEHVKWPEIAAETRFLIFFDLDHLHQLNEQFESYAPVDAMIKQALSILRSTDFVCGQLNSGDEFVLAIKEIPERKESDPQGLISRLIESLARQGLSATFAVAEVKSIDLMENLASAIAEVKAAKKARGITR